MKLFRCRCWLLLGMLAPGWLSLPAAQTGPLVEKIEVRHVGPPAVSDDLVRANIHIKIGDPYNPDATTDDIRALKATGYFRDIRVEADRTENGGVKLIYVVQGQPVLGEVRFEGNRKYSNSKLLKLVKSKMGEPLDDYKLFSDAQEIKKLNDFYWSEGYIDFEIKEVKLDYSSPTRLAIRFIVYEGQRYKVGSVEFKGNARFTAEQIRQGVVVLGHPVKPRMLEGEIFTPKGLEKDREAIEDFYGAHGYIGKGDRERIPVGVIKNANTERGTMDLVYQIEEGEQSRIEKIEIHGNTKTKDKVIRRELAVSPGEVFDMVRVKLSKERLEGLQYFTPGKVQTSVEPTDVPNLKNLVVDVEEGPSGNFYFGAGFSSIDQLFGYVGMTQGNLDLFNPPS